MVVWAASKLAGVAEVVVEEVVARIPFYADTSTTVPVQELRRSVETFLHMAVDAVARGQANGVDLAEAREIAGRRARQGAPLPEVLQVYRIAFRSLWKAMLDHERLLSQEAPAALLDAVTTLVDVMDQHAVASTDAYREVSASMLVFQSRRRSALVEALLTGHPTPDSGPWEAASLLGFPPGGRHVVVVADTPRVAEEGLPEVEERLAERGIPSGWRLTPAQQLGVIGLRDEPVDTVVRVLESIPGARAGVSPVSDSVVDAPRSARLAQAALQMIPALRSGVHVFSASPLAALVVCSPDEGVRLAARVLGPVLALPADDRTLLIDTLWVYLEQSGSADNAAPFLYCHPNTVRYRLRRLQDMTSRHLSSPTDVAELTAAVYALRLNPGGGAARTGGGAVGVRP
ncbi:helix-turn-helix domain-containing protein [Tsukamurella soli]|uniref:Helix-turn-helix domain-containing protein n=2 Tax=Tsukamurella soli TaxID=644556 RepID=A0ABP8K0F2_9ACTN